MLKLCTKCNVTKPITEFSVARRKSQQVLKNGGTFKRSVNSTAPEVTYHTYCKECCSLRAKEFRRKYKEITGNCDYRGSGLRTQYSIEDRPLMSAIRRRLTQTKSNAKRTGVVIDLTEHYLYEIFKKQQAKCALSGVPMLIDGNTNLRLSLDKIIPENGYVVGNVQWTIFAANRAKGDMTNKDFIRLCGLVIERATTIESAIA